MKSLINNYKTESSLQVKKYPAKMTYNLNNMSSKELTNIVNKQHIQIENLKGALLDIEEKFNVFLRKALETGKAIDLIVKELKD